MSRVKLFLDKNVYHFYFGNNNLAATTISEIATICHSIGIGISTMRHVYGLMKWDTSQEMLNLFLALLRNSEKLVQENYHGQPVPGEDEETGTIKKGEKIVVKDEDVLVLREIRQSGANAFVTFDYEFAKYLKENAVAHQIEIKVFHLPPDADVLLEYLRSV